MEIWKTINDTDNKYAVSNLVNVKRLEHYTMVGPNKIHYGERILKQQMLNDKNMILDLLFNTFSKDELLFISEELLNRICSYKTAGEK